MTVGERSERGAGRDRQAQDDGRARLLALVGGSVGEALAGVIAASRDAILVVDSGGLILLASPRAADLFGYGVDELRATAVESLLPERSRERLSELCARVAREPGRHAEIGLDLQGVGNDGREFPIEIRVNSAPVENGALAVLSIRPRSEAEASLGALLEAAPDAIVTVDLDGRITFANSQTGRLFGYARAELIGQRVELLLPEALRDAHSAHRHMYAENPQTRPMGAGLELFGRRKDGSEFPAEISLSPLETEHGTLVTSAIRDVTERKHAEETRAQLAAIVEATADAVIGHTLDGVIRSWNRAAQALFGQTPAEAIGSHLAMLVPADRREELEDVLERVRSGESIDHVETSWLHRDGHSIDVSLSIAPIPGHSGRPGWAATIARDMTHLRRAEEERRRLLDEQAARARAEAALDARNEFISVAAHELRTPLTGIKGYAQFTLRMIERDEPVDREGLAERLRALDEQADRVVRLIDQLLDVSRIEERKLALHRQFVDVAGVVHQVVRLTEARSDASQRFLLDAPSGSWANVDVMRIEQVVANLLDNALKYSPGSEPVDVEVRPDSGGVRISVRDYGVGIPSEHRSLIFERFYQAHRPENQSGMGLGLFISREIVERHGGSLRLEEPEGGGSRFVVWLPATPGT